MLINIVQGHRGLVGPDIRHDPIKLQIAQLAKSQAVHIIKGHLCKALIPECCQIIHNVSILFFPHIAYTSLAFKKELVYNYFYRFRYVHSLLS